MLDESNIGIWGAIIGSAIGVAGGIFGTWMSIAKTPAGPKRALIVKISIFSWVGILSFIALIFLLPNNWGWILYVVYAPALVIWIRTTNKKLR